MSRGDILIALVTLITGNNRNDNDLLVRGRVRKDKRRAGKQTTLSLLMQALLLRMVATTIRLEKREDSLELPLAADEIQKIFHFTPFRHFSRSALIPTHPPCEISAVSISHSTPIKRDYSELLCQL